MINIFINIVLNLLSYLYGIEIMLHLNITSRINLVFHSDKVKPILTASASIQCICLSNGYII